uniref:RNase III domain-containing protein n=1 Tax=Globodera pallida TaxID=36090 RepID=A0A183BJY8_GLOPA
MVQEDSNVELGYAGLVRLLEDICSQKIVTANGKLRTLWCQMMAGYLTKIDFEKRIVPHISMRHSARKSRQKLKDWQDQQRHEFEKLEIADEMPMREQLFWQAQRVGAALLYTLIYGEMKELVDRQLIDKPPKQGKPNLGQQQKQLKQRAASDQKRRMAGSSSKRERTTANKQQIVQEISNNSDAKEDDEEEGTRRQNIVA